MQREEDVLHDATTLGDIEEFFIYFFSKCIYAYVEKILLKIQYVYVHVLSHKRTCDIIKKYSSNMQIKYFVINITSIFRLNQTEVFNKKAIENIADLGFPVQTLCSHRLKIIWYSNLLIMMKVITETRRAYYFRQDSYVFICLHLMINVLLYLW